LGFYKENFMDKKELQEFILKKEKEGKIVFNTLEGLAFIDINEFIEQPTEGILYDLNRDKVTCMTWINEGQETWINNYAVALVITKLKEHYENKNVLMLNLNKK